MHWRCDAHAEIQTMQPKCGEVEAKVTADMTPMTADVYIFHSSMFLIRFCFAVSRYPRAFSLYMYGLRFSFVC